MIKKRKSNRKYAVLLDIDDTVLNFIETLCKLHNYDNGTTLVPSDLTDWNFDELNIQDVRGTKVTGENLRQTFSKYESHGLYAILKPLEGARNAINTMKLLGYKIVFITARNPQFELQTRLNLFANNIHFDELHFTDNKVAKVKELSKVYNFVLYCDDNYENITKVFENCKVKYCYLVNKRHNERLELDDEIGRINGIWDVLKYLKEVL